MDNAHRRHAQHIVKGFQPNPSRPVTWGVAPRYTVEALRAIVAPRYTVEVFQPLRGPQGLPEGLLHYSVGQRPTSFRGPEGLPEGLSQG